jgi:cellulose synthase/poly-beta-1,6-N-acetylglucosamine synthase-like glycosyltransferase
MKVSIVIPCYNEKATIEKIVEAMRAAPIQSKEIIIVDDGSRDGTQTIRNAISNTVDQVIYQPVNRGKGAALRSGFAAATGDIILVQDASSTAPKITLRFLSHSSPGKQTRFSARVLWAGDRTGSFFSGTWLAIGF